MNKSNIITAIALVFASVQSLKIDVSDGNFKVEFTKTALAKAEEKIETLEGQEFGLASVCKDE